MPLIRERYPDFGPTLAAEMLARHQGLTVSRETPRQWMADAGLWLSRRQQRTFHQPRSRREALGELMQLRFVPSESTRSYFEALGVV